MTVREYLTQGYLLEQRIACDMRKAEAARALAASVSAPLTDGVCISTSPAGEARFVRVLERGEEMEERVAAELDLLLNLKEQMDGVIRSVPGEDFRLLLQCRYTQHMSWACIAGLLGISRNTALAWHKTALSRAVLPENPIDIRLFPGGPLPEPTC